MNSLLISFFDCCKAVRGVCVSVREESRAAYVYCETAARRLKKWITVTAKEYCRVIVRGVRTYVRRVFRNTGSEILKQTAILRL